MKKILIDLTQIPINKVGVGVYAENLVYQLIKKKSNLFVYLLIQDDDKDFLERINRELKLSSNKNFYIKKINHKFFRKLILRIIMEQFFIPVYLIRKKIDIVHSLHYTFPIFTNKKKVVTYHDMTYYIYPEMHEKIKVIIFKFFIKYGIKKCDKIISVSESTKRDCKREVNLNINEDKIEVVPLGREKIYNLERNQNEIKKVKDKFSISNSYILFIGTLEPRKNIDGLIKAYSKIKDKIDDKLVIVGKKGWFYKDIFKLVDEFKLNDRIIFTGFITEEDKVNLLKGAKLFIYPSFYEGFGIPVLESMSCGIPTITSNTSSLSEVAGNGARLIEPNDIEDMSKSILEVLLNDELRKVLIKEGQKQISKFTWENCAEGTENIYNNLFKFKKI